jgi:uncharacterized protein (TIGR02246 family)
MIDGVHAILYSTNPDADRAFLRDIVGLAHVDAGHGWLIFALPPAELAVHPTDQGDRQELYFMCPDIATFVEAMAARGVACGPVQDQRWGLLTTLTLPGGGAVGVYQPRHPRPAPAGAVAADAARAAYTALLQAWNARDAAAFARCFTREAEVVGFDGSLMHGREQIESELQRIFASHQTAAYVARIRDVRPAGPGAAILQSVVGMVPPGRDTIDPKVNAIQSAVFVMDGPVPSITHFQNTPAAFHQRPDLAQSLTSELGAVLQSGRIVD